MDQESDRSYPNGDVRDTVLSELVEAFERDGEAALQRFAAQQPALASRAQALVGRLEKAGLLRPQVRCGRFHLEHRIGRGAMGEVWRARDPELGRDVAIKRIAPEMSGNRHAIERFRREANAIARLRHPSVVTVYEIGDHEGSPFLVMELVDGGSLHDALTSEGEAARRLFDEKEVCRLGVDLCAALQAAHDAGVVHRDVKPGNVLIRASGAPLLSDFGLALCAGDSLVTRAGEFVGTPAYAPPEVLLGGESSIAGDIYSLATTLYECVAGRPPFVAATALEVAALAARSAVPPVRRWSPQVSPDFEAVIARALEREPARRYPSAAEFGLDLARVERGEPTLTHRVGPMGRMRRWARRRPAVATAIGLPMLLATVFVVVLVVWQGVELARYERLADTRLISDLRAELTTLWPADQETVPRVEAWLRRARTVLQRGDLHRTDRDRLSRALEVATFDFDGSSRDEAARWQHAVLVDLCKAVEEFEPLVPVAEFRLATARTLRDLTIRGADACAKWQFARAAIMASPRYHGLDLQPQFGLVPLEQNEGGLWEFWHPATGARPLEATAGADSRWVMAPETGMVFVLMPGGRCTVGMSPPTPERPMGSPYVGEGGSGSGLVAQELELSPYFLSKYEMTQAQYERLTGERPSHFDSGKRMGYSSSCPVECVSWQTLMAVLTPAGLAMPTDAQWEVAYRCGTTTIYPTGDDVHSLYGRDNVLDQTWVAESGGPGDVAEPFRDGYSGPSPVDAFPGNIWGFHGMIGNVAELCADMLHDKGDPRRPGDGLFGSSGSRFVALRGASWVGLCSNARSGWTGLGTFDRRANFVGVRPMLAVR